MSAKLLLRLFESQYFNVHLAVSYLRTYKDSVGITYYLAQRLAQVDEAELEFYWPQLCHLLVSHTFESGALEALIVKKCEESIHLAMLTLWQMQASLSDLSSNPSTAPFATCRRLYNRVQHIIFSDALLESSVEACQSRQKVKSHFAKPALVGIGMAMAAFGQPHLSSFHGQIAVEEGRKQEGLASNDFTKQEPVDASMSDSEDGETLESNPNPNQHSLPYPHQRSAAAKANLLKGNPSYNSMLTKNSQDSATTHATPLSYLPGAPLPLANPSRSPALTSARLKAGHSHLIKRASSSSSSPIHSNLATERSIHAQSMVDLPSFTDEIQRNDATKIVGQYDMKQDKMPRSAMTIPALKPFLLENRTARLPGHKNHVADRTGRRIQASESSFGSPRLAVSTPALHPFSSSTPALAQSKFDYQTDLPPETLSLLLRSYACRSQLDLITSLQDIATRLIVVPRLARLSALRAELTVLNHGLPRGCCLCLGCSGQDTGSLVSTASSGPRESSTASSTLASLKSFFFKADSATKRHAHHRIVRISPSESVVLNSADRAPFLIHVEVLEGDLDFDPTRRQNAEDIGSVMAEREGRISKPRSVTPDPALPPSESTDTSASGNYGPQRSNVVSSPNASPDGYTQMPILAAHSDSTNGVSEISGPDSPDILEIPSIGALEEVDLVEQTYGSFSVYDAASFVPGEYHPNIQNRSVDEKAWRRADSRRTFQLHNATTDENRKSLPQNDGEGVPSNASTRLREPLSIDEYAERMRMAAIMLAQVTASQQAPLSGTDAISGVVGAGVGMGVNLTYGVGSVVGSVVGVGFDVMKASLGAKRSTSITTPTPAAESVDEGPADLPAPVTASSAVADLSNVSGSVNPSHFPENIRSSQSPRQGNAKSTASSPTLPMSRSSRQRVLSAQEASAIRERIMSEMMSLEEERMSRMRAATRSERVPMLASSVPHEVVEEESIVMRALNKDDPSGSVLSESWTEKKSRIRKGSPYGHLLSWDVFSVIVKTGADLRQEQLAVQLIKEFGRIWTETDCPHWIRYFRILVTSESTGLMETITDAVSVHSIKKEAYSKMTAANTAHAGYLPSFTLYDHFVEEFGQPDSPRYRRAQDAFLKSLASYSIITYLLQIKDRHNGNILIDKQGHLMHIDFGFMLSNSPGSLGFEMAPFKLSQDYVDILGGLQSSKFLEFRALLKRLFRDARQHAERIVTLVELMQTGSKLPCFGNGLATVHQLRERFQLGLSVPQLDDHVDRLVLSSAASAFTRLYDTFQRHSQGVL